MIPRMSTERHAHNVPTHTHIHTHTHTKFMYIFLGYVKEVILYTCMKYMHSTLF